MRFLIIILTFALVVVSSSSFAVPLTTVTNKHNLSSNSSNTVRATSDTRICVFCHTPHGASAQSALWNRKDPSTASFPLYASATVDIKTIPEAQYDNSDPSTYPNGATRMCLSCHDGVSAVGEVLNMSAQIAMTYNTLGAAYPGGVNADGAKVVVDLATSHPVSFVYTGIVKDAINTAEAGINYKLPAAVPLDNMERLQCTTCHDPHEDTRSGGYTLPFWRNYSGNDIADYDNTCQDCHLGSDWGGSWGGTPATIH